MHMATPDRQGRLQEYIEAANKKSGVFREVIIEADYNPMRCARENIRIPTHDISDPLKVTANQVAREASLVRAASLHSCAISPARVSMHLSLRNHDLHARSPAHDRTVRKWFCAPCRRVRQLHGSRLADMYCRLCYGTSWKARPMDTTERRMGAQSSGRWTPSWPSYSDRTS